MGKYPTVARRTPGAPKISPLPARPSGLELAAYLGRPPLNDEEMAEYLEAVALKKKGD